MHITIRRGLTTNLFLFYEVLTSTVAALNYTLHSPDLCPGLLLYLFILQCPM